MCAHVLLNLLSELEKTDKKRGLSSILSLFRNEFNKFNYTGARMLDSIKIILKSHFCRKNVVVLSKCAQRNSCRHNVSRKSVNHYILSIVLYGVISLPDARLHVHLVLQVIIHLVVPYTCTISKNDSIILDGQKCGFIRKKYKKYLQCIFRLSLLTLFILNP